MKIIGILLIIITIILFLTTNQKTTNNIQVNTVETPQKSFDTPMNTYKERIEAQNIANTIQSPGSYLGSRVEARGSAKQSLRESNKRREAENKAIEDMLN